jgi:hypothetical protein
VLGAPPFNSVEKVMRTVAFGLLFFLLGGFVSAQSRDVLTYHYDNYRTGWNNSEPSLTPRTFKDSSFGLLYDKDYFDEQIDAQPLIVSGLPIGGQTKEVVFIATENNSLYAVDAATGAKIASRSFGAPAPSSALCGNGSDHLGINSTPVINEARDILYLIAAVWGGSDFDYVLFAVDLRKLDDPDPTKRLPDKYTPVKVAATATLSDGSAYAFQSQHARQRSALLLSKDRVYAGFASMCDWQPEVSRGWLLGWDAHTLVPIGVELTDHRPTSAVQSGRLGSIWMSGYGPAAEADGDIFVVTGNSKLPKQGETLPQPPVGPNSYLSDSVVRLSDDLQVRDWFTPSDPHFGQTEMDKHDNDLGSGGVVLLPDGDGAAALPVKGAVAAGKLGQMYLVDRHDLGHFDPSGVNHVQDEQSIGACYCGPSYFEGPDGIPRIVSSGNEGLIVWRVSIFGQQVKFAQQYKATDSLGTDYWQGGFMTSISSNGRQPDTQIIWAVRRPQMADSPQSLTLHALDSKDGASLCVADAGLWPMDAKNGAAPNAVPVVANGKVFVASYKELRAFGKGGSPACGVKIAANAEHQFAAQASSAKVPTEGQFGEFKGVIIESSDDRLRLKTGAATVDVDLRKVLQSGRLGNIDPGKPVTIRGTRGPNDSVVADSIYSGD